MSKASVYASKEAFEKEFLPTNMPRVTSGWWDEESDNFYYHDEFLRGAFVCFQSLEARVKELENQLEAEKQGHRTQAARLIGERGQLRNRAEAAEAELEQLKAQESVAMENFRAAMEGIGHIRRTIEETFGGLHGTHSNPDVLVDCKEICDAICDYYRAGAEPHPAVLPPKLNFGEREGIRLTVMPDGSKRNQLYGIAYNQAIDDALSLACQPQRFVVKLPEIRDCCSSHIRCQVALQRFEEAIKSANGEIAE